MNIRLIILTLFLVLLLPFGVSSAEDWRIENFESDINIQSDGKVQVEETIEVYFNSEKHGIFRDMPYVYQSEGGEEVYTEAVIQNVLVNGNAVPYEVDKNKANVRIKIGDPDIVITGRQTYTVQYMVAGVISSYESYDELYWNVTGSKWDVEIGNVAATVTLPAGEVLQSACYEGYFGATDKCSSKVAHDRSAQFASDGRLQPGEGMTVAVGFSKGIVPIVSVEPPLTLEDIIVQWPTIVSFAFLLVIGNVWLLWHWWRNGRDAWWLRKSLHDEDAKIETKPLWGYEPVGPEYDPPENLRPAEIGTLIDEKADTLDISATIVDLAVRGHLIIEEVPKKWFLGSKDYTFKRTDKSAQGLRKYEDMLLDALFKNGTEVQVSDLKNFFYKDLFNIKKEVYREVTHKKLFAGNPEHTRSIYIGIGAGVLFGGILLAVLGGFILQGMLLGSGVAIAIVGIIAMFYGPAMPRRTAHGRELLRMTRGYELFVSGTEKYRQPFFERENIFMEVLPYAMVFGVTKKLAKAFEEMGIEPSSPAWYHGTTPFYAVTFAQDMQNFSKDLSTNMVSSPSSSGSGGGGFSGGGFGGGGGGSW